MAWNEQESGVLTVGDTQVPYRVSRSRRRKRTIALYIHPEAVVHVKAPVRTSPAYIHALLRKRAGWIMHKFDILKSHAGADGPQIFVNGKIIRYLGHGYRLHVTRDGNRPQGCRLAPRRIEVNIHDGGLSDEDLRQEVRLEILLALKRRARVKLPQRMDLWAKKLGVRYRKFMLSDPDRRWGSCSAHDVMRLNWRLIMAPLPLIDYVAAHELCHVVHKNHSARFWALLESVMPDYRQRRKKLRQLEAGLML